MSSWKINVTDPKKTGLRLFSIVDKSSKVEVHFAEFNKDFDVHASLAWAGARTSRSPDSYIDIFEEIMAATKEGKAAAGEKLANVFTNYGHASVAGMSPVFLYINKIPIHLAFWIFNHLSLGDGQELSTRYVKLDDLGITPIELLLPLGKLEKKKADEIKKDWENIQKKAKENYEKWTPIVEDAHRKYFGEDIKKSTLTARTLDVTRMWIPSGASTSMALLTSARMWIDMIIQLREHQDPLGRMLAEQIFAALNLQKEEEGRDIQANLSGLTEFSEAKMTITSNLADLRGWLQEREDFLGMVDKFKDHSPSALPTRVSLLKGSATELTIMQYVLVLYPFIPEQILLSWVKDLTDKDLKELGKIIFNKHMHHDLMRNMGDIRSDSLFVLETSMAYQRDLNRHRAFGRFVPMNETDDYLSILKAGWLDILQLREGEYLKEYRDEFNKDMSDYYSHIFDLFDKVSKYLGDVDHSYILRLLPLGHRIKMHMSAPITQQNYMYSLRTGGGGDFGYRKLVWDMLEIARKDPFNSGMLPDLVVPDCNDKGQFCSRS